MSVSDLTILWNGIRVGTLMREDGRVDFAYAV